MPPRELTMPKLSDSMADAVILRWLKAAGEAFERGEGLIEVETDKATVIYEAEWDGTLDAILAPEGATVAVGEPIATLANGDGAAVDEARPAPSPPERLAPPPVRPGRRAAACCRRRGAGTSRRDAGRAPDGSRARRLAPRRHRHRSGRQDHRRGRSRARPRRTAGPRRARPGLRQGRGQRSRADADAGDDRAPDDRVGDDDPRLHRLDGHRRVGDRCVAAGGSSRGEEARSLNDFVLKAVATRRSASSLASTPPTSRARSSATHG